MESSDGDHISLDEGKEYIAPKEDTENSSSEYNGIETIFSNIVSVQSFQKCRNEI